MAGPITHWPGMQAPESPSAALLIATSRTPMFSQDYGPRYTGPFNAGGRYGTLFELGMPAIMQMMMGNNYTPAQFFPEQQLFDQMQAEKFFQANQQAMAMAARMDSRSIAKTLGGVTQMMTGKPLTRSCSIILAASTMVVSGVTEITS